MKKGNTPVDIRILKLGVAAVDFFSFQLALIFGYWLWIRFPWHGHWQYFDEFSLMLWILPPIALVVFKSVGLYKPEMGVIGVQEQGLIFKAVWVIYFFVFALTFFFRQVHFSRLAMLYSMIASLVIVSIERYFIRHLYFMLNQRGIANRKALIYGAGYAGVRLERWIRQSPQLGIQVLGYLDDDVERLTKKPEDPPVLGGIDRLKGLVSRRQVSLLFIANRQLREERVIEIMQRCRDLDIRCWVIPALYHFHVENVEVQNIGGIPLLGVREQVARRSYELIKHVLDRLTAFALVLIFSPILALTALALWGSSGTPVFFRQVRVGKGGKRFTIYKFRTLKTRASRDQVSPELKNENSMVLTPFASFLRRTGFDELPQLINVLKGEMSLVGPRPEMPFLVDRYGPLEKERLTVRPGVTGLWQISDDRKRLLIHENMDYDLYYVEHMSFNLDLAILVKTTMAVLKRFFSSEVKPRPMIVRRGKNRRQRKDA